ncbi:MAG: 50S ribosomal protein L18 [Ottowia sp.]|nr:50S ribosomal protein L18 [Ottowia sp.]
MLTKKARRLRRARRTRIRIAKQEFPRLTVNRTNAHIYAIVTSSDGSRVLACASTVEKDVRQQLGEVGKGATVSAAEGVGKVVAERARQAGVEQVVFDRAGYAYHGRVKALADAARQTGLKF